MRGFLHALFTIGIPAVALACLWAGCGSSEEPASEAPAAGNGPRAEMRRLLQTASDAANARPAGEVTWYTPDNLYDYIDGQAEEFLDAGFIGLAHGEYKAKGATGDAYVEVDLYRMTSAEATKAVMEPPPPDGRMELAPGVQAYRAETLCEFAAGPYYVRITARLDAEGQADTVDALARSIASSVKAD